MRRAGKSVNLDMLCQFLQLNLDENMQPIFDANEIKNSYNYKLFAKTKIFKEISLVNDNFGKYPVIKLSLTDTKSKTYENFNN